MMLINRKGHQKGIAIVEFTIVASVLLLVLFTIMDAGRYMFTAQTLNDITRKAARLATVCQVGDADIATMPSIVEIAPSTFSASNLTIQYLNNSGGIVTNPASNYAAIASVRATVSNVGYQSFSLFPLFTSGDAFADFVTEVPAENLGVLRETKNRTGDKKTDC
ncbi:pilus biosynthesis protein TadE [Vibrio sp. MACH09]|uniref:TadE/TadG family type IV pilus assembly protein n=1 Tax=unclassified Vibrio TaxID=2614977 RepID=UPI0020A40993|nr:MULTISPECIES: TadE/TadG family type IV pilus assembly protein [unclassified Vibrio]GLO61708.1 pilus biosynthesis protein TadE [Vibrio sp. MACH09]